MARAGRAASEGEVRRRAFSSGLLAGALPLSRTRLFGRGRRTAAPLAARVRSVLAAAREAITRCASQAAAAARVDRRACGAPAHRLRRRTAGAAAPPLRLRAATGGAAGARGRARGRWVRRRARRRSLALRRLRFVRRLVEEMRAQSVQRARCGMSGDRLRGERTSRTCHSRVVEAAGGGHLWAQQVLGALVGAWKRTESVEEGEAAREMLWRDEVLRNLDTSAHVEHLVHAGSVKRHRPHTRAWLPPRGAPRPPGAGSPPE